MEKKQKSIAQQLEEVTQEICDNYCKYPERYTAEEWDSVCEELCYKCPLNKLS